MTMDDFETDEGLAARDAEYERAYAGAIAAGVPARRSGRAGAVAATATIDVARAAERAPLAPARAIERVLVVRLAHSHGGRAAGESFRDCVARTPTDPPKTVVACKHLLLYL